MKRASKCPILPLASDAGPGVSGWSNAMLSAKLPSKPLLLAGATMAVAAMLAALLLGPHAVSGQGTPTVIITGATAPSYLEHRTDIVETYAVSDPENRSFEWSISGADAGKFSINSSGELTFNEPPDFENPGDADTGNEYELTVTATVADRSASLEVTVTVTDGNDPPAFSAGNFLREFTLKENRSNDKWQWYLGFTLGTFTATDTQDDSLRWTIGGPDKDSFVYSFESLNTQADPNIWRSTLTIINTPMDYENPQDADQDGVYEITLDVSDGDLVTSAPVTVTMLDVNEAPAITGEADVYYVEGSTADVGAYSAADPEGGTATLTLGGADADSFTFSDGTLKFNSAPDYETKNSYSVTFTSTDEADESNVVRTSSRDVSVTITEFVEGLAITRGADPSYVEDGTGVVKTYTASDPENRSFEWSISGTDAGQFSINSSGELRFNESPDFENPTDADTNNEYELTVTATAGDQSDANDSLEVTVTVTDGNDPPIFTQGGDNREITLAESRIHSGDGLQAEGWQSSIGVYRAIDPQDDWMEWSIGGPDKDSFKYGWFMTNRQFSSVPDIWTTELFNWGAPLDYESPQDADQDGVYEISIDVTDGALVTSVPVTVTVLDVNEAPVIMGEAAVGYAEGSTADVGAYSATDPDGGPVTLTLGGADADSFTFSDGALRFNSAPDHETKTCHGVTFTATDEADESGVTRSSSLEVIIKITSENDEAPVRVTGLSATSRPASGDTYALGETIRVTLTFNEAVGVIGTPRLKIDLDPSNWGEKWASYESGSGTTSLTFAYQVLEPNLSTQGIAVLENTLELNGGTICPAAARAEAELAHAGLDHDPNHKVDWQANSRATGAPIITGTARVGETLTADTSGISDANGLANPTFSYQWRADEADISGATSSTYTLVSSDEGKTVTVQVSFTDDAGNAESLTSAATAAVAPPLLTASFVNVPAEHDGKRLFSFDLHFSDNFPGRLDYRTLRDKAIQAENGRVIEAQRVAQGENRRWTITVRPASSRDVVITLPAATDRSAAGAVCTEAGRKLSNTTSVTVVGPPEVTGVTVSSNPASGDTYARGETIRIRVTFSEAITATGSPRIQIDMDPAHWGAKWASYESGSGTSSLTFTHEVVEPNISTQGIAVLGDTLQLNGGTIRSSANDADAELSHDGLAHDPDHKVDWQ